MTEASPGIPLVKPIEALRYFRAKGFTFGFAWQDVWQEEHARAFTVAKAMKLQILELIRGAVDTAIDEGQTLAMFREQLQPLLEKEGWWGRKMMVDPLTAEHKVVQLGSPRRLRTIYQVNMRTAQAAGRWERIQQSKKLFPLLEYSAVLDGRERPQHHAWSGTILPVDDDWWSMHYPPCGWHCRCTVKPRNQRMLDAKGLQVTEKPIEFPVREYTNKRTGEVTKLEDGIDPGWSYNVGKAALEGVAPSPIGGDGEVSAAAGIAPELARFFAPFGLEGRAAITKGKVFTDVAGWPIAVTRSMLMDARGTPAFPAARQPYLAAAAAAIISPDEIRWRWVKRADGLPMLMRRYVGKAAIVDVSRADWRFFAAGEPGFEADRLRQGEIAWSRQNS
jgi:SPP1 gp7 family putative phage head morphogenesis protein